MTAPGDHGLTFRQDYFGDPAAWHALSDLLRDVFSIDVSLLDQFGGPDPSSMPFAYFDEVGTCIANFSAFSMPVVIGGQEVKAAGFQSGAVRPEWRGRGLYRDLMRRTFHWTEEQDFEVGLLLTSKPALYEPYGFKAVQQHCFVTAPPVVLPDAPSATLLTLPEDGATILSLLQRRLPVSRHFAVMRQAEMFLLNACFDPDIRLSVLAGDEVMVAWKLEGNCLRLLDVVGRSIPSLAAIVAQLSVSPDRIDLSFPPDLICPESIAMPHESHTVLMMRDPAGHDIAHPVMLSPMAEF